jgi:hypothetical protein
MARAQGGMDESGQVVENPLKKFDSVITKRFCLRNRISMVILSHEVKNCGYELHHNVPLHHFFQRQELRESVPNNAVLLLLQPG